MAKTLTEIKREINHLSLDLSAQYMAAVNVWPTEASQLLGEALAHLELVTVHINEAQTKVGGNFALS